MAEFTGKVAELGKGALGHSHSGSTGSIGSSSGAAGGIGSRGVGSGLTNDKGTGLTGHSHTGSTGSSSGHTSGYTTGEKGAHHTTPLEAVKNVVTGKGDKNHNTTGHTVGYEGKQ